MFRVKAKTSGSDFQPHWQGSLSDYVTAIAWSPTGQLLAASSAAGEVTILTVKTSQTTLLQTATGQSADCLSFSHDGQFLAVGGQNGQVKIWHLSAETPQLLATLGNGRDWIDRMAWSPKRNQLAFSLGRYVQVWDSAMNDIATTLNFETSSVLDLGWHPDGKRLTIGGYQGIKIWTADDWDDDPYLLSLDSASVAVAWSPDGKYIASGNLDRTITVLEWENPHPWVMRGFPGKVRQLAWSNYFTKTSAPLLAAASAESIVIWEKQADELVGWEGRVLEHHEDMVQSIQFQPDTVLFASAAADGCICLWNKAKQLAQILEGAPDGFSCLSWHSQGQSLAAGGQNGELIIWSKEQRGQGFGRR
ncbi:WD40 repeat domain-containing protein [Phormidesmis sp. 146-12]